MIAAAVAVVIAVCLALILPPLFAIREAANRARSANSLRQIALAIHYYNDFHGELPHNTYSPDGRPLLSWRVHILPYLEQDNLYREFDLDEPWDSPHNRRLLIQMPPVYAHPERSRDRGTRTHYRAFSSPGALFEHRPSHVRPARIPLVGRVKDPRTLFAFDSVQDGLADTILVVEAWDPVEWTKPDDLDASPGKPFPGMGGFRWKERFQAVMADGGVRVIRLDTPEDELRALVTHSGGEAVRPD